MGSGRTKPQSLDLGDLLEGIGAGTIALPDFQRDFDWTEKDVQALLVTVLVGWPAGSLLLMEGAPTFFEVRALESAPKIVDASDVEYVVLDGQQRLTALYQALGNRGPFVYAIDLGQLDGGGVDNLEEAVRYIKRGRWDEQYALAKQQHDHGLLPLYALQTASDFFAWRDQVIAASASGEREGIKNRLSRLYRDLLSGVHKYDFPAVLVSNKIEPAAIARIFERVNKTGMSLSAFDLVVARSFAQDWNLRRKYEDLRRDSELIDTHLRDDGIPILQAISLKYESNVRESAVINLPPKLVRENWDGASEAMDAALRFLVSRLGVLNPNWVPNRIVIVILTALQQDDLLFPQQDQLEEWFWASAFAQSFDVASNTRAAADYRTLAGERKERLQYQRGFIIKEVLREATRQSHASIWRAFVCALAVNNPRDLLSGDPLVVEGDQGIPTLRRGTVVQSIFPRGLPVDDDEASPHLRALSMALMTRETSRRLRRSQLQYELREISSNDGSALESQFFPEPSVLGDDQSWRDIVQARLSSLEPFLRRMTGMSLVDWDPGDETG